MSLPCPIHRVRDRVMRHGRQAAAYQILNPDFRYWLDDDLDAAAGYLRRGNWWAVGGGPACPAAAEREAVRRLEAAAAAEGCRVVFVCGDDVLRRALAPDHAVLTLGAEPVWQPQQWWHRPQESASLRKQLNRARNKGVVVERWSPQRLIEGHAELRPIIADWLATRPLPAMQFLNDSRTLDGVLTDRHAWVARRGGRAVAFLLASPVVMRGGYLFEQIARGRDAPNGTAEVLIDGAMRDLARWGCHYATLGLVVLSEQGGWSQRDPPWARALFAFARVHGRRFYNYDGLARFRAKLRPDAWEPIHLIANTRPFPFAALYAAGAAFCGEHSPLGVVSRGVGTAFVTECDRVRAFLSRPPLPTPSWKGAAPPKAVTP